MISFGQYPMIKQLTNQTNKQVSFKSNQCKINFGRADKLDKTYDFNSISKIDGLTDMEIKLLENLLNGKTKRKIRYNYVPTAIHEHQMVLGKPGINEYGNPNRTFVTREYSYEKVSGSGNSILAATRALIKQAYYGKLDD